MTNCLASLLIFLSAFLVIWLYGDAERRGRSGLLVAALYVALGPLALLLWFFMRLFGQKAGKR